MYIYCFQLPAVHILNFVYDAVISESPFVYPDPDKKSFNSSDKN